MLIELTNRMWFSVVCTLIDNDMRQHSGQNVVDSRGAATNPSRKRDFSKTLFWPEEFENAGFVL